MYGLSEQELDIARPLVFARIDRTASTIVLHEPEIQKDRKQRMLDRDVYVFVYAYVYVYVDVYVYVYVFVLLSVGKFFFQKSFVRKMFIRKLFDRNLFDRTYFRPTHFSSQTSSSENVPSKIFLAEKLVVAKYSVETVSAGNFSSEQKLCP